MFDITAFIKKPVSFSSIFTMKRVCFWKLFNQGVYLHPKIFRKFVLCLHLKIMKGLDVI